MTTLYMSVVDAPFPPHSNKKQLVDAVKEWKQKHDEYETVSKQLQQIKKDKHQLTVQLIDLMNARAIQHIDLKSGRINAHHTRVKKPLSAKYLKTQLPRFFSSLFGEEDGQAAALSEQVIRHLLQEREEAVKTKLTLKLNAAPKPPAAEAPLPPPTTTT